MTQAETVIKHIEKWGSINSPEAIRLYGITRLAAVVERINRERPEHAMASTGHSNSDGLAVYTPDLVVRASCIRDKLVRELNSAKGAACLVRILSTGLLALSRLAQSEGDISHVSVTTQGTLRPVREQGQSGSLH